MSITTHREGIEAGRLDIFVDGAFAFTLTLLAIGGEVIPDNLGKLVHLLGAIPASAACFAQMAHFWYAHVQWRHLCTRMTTQGLILSLLLVFFALIFVYPLHMVYASLFNVLSGGALSSEFGLTTSTEARTLFTIYGVAYACMAGTLSLLYRHAARVSAEHGQVNTDARVRTLTWLMPAGISLFSALVALLLPDTSPAWAWGLPGAVYFLMMGIGPTANRMRRKLAVTAAA